MIFDFEHGPHLREGEQQKHESQKWKGGAGHRGVGGGVSPPSSFVKIENRSKHQRNKAKGNKANKKRQGTKEKGKAH